MAFGTYKAPFPRGRVLRGWDPQNPTKQTKALPVKEETKENGMKGSEWIYPGHLIAGVVDGTKTVWTKAMPASGDFVLAVASAASTDLDVINARSLVGLEVTDSFRIATPFFRTNEGDSYAVGTKLTYCKATEGTPAGSLNGYIRPAVAGSEGNPGDPVIGVVVESGTGKNGSVDLQSSFVEAIDSSSIRANAYYVIYDTAYQPTK